MSIHDTNVFPWLIQEKEFIQRVIDTDKRVLGICLGAQLIADALGASVYQNPQKEIGWFPIERIKNSDEPLAQLFPARMDAFHWHGETFDLPEKAMHIARSAACENQAFSYNNAIALQFHLEPTIDTVQGLINNGSSEIVEAPYIQTADEMLKDEYRFHAINELMNDVLNYQLNMV